MKLFYIPNEVVEGDQLGPRAVFQRMVEEGDLSGFCAFPLDLRMRERGPADAQAELLAQLRREQPDLVLVSKMGVPHRLRGVIQAWRVAAPQAFVAYHDGDSYGWVLSRLPGSTRDVLREVDVTFTVGLGHQRTLMEFVGGGPVEYTPSWTDTIRFGQDTPTTKECQVVLFGSYQRLRRLKIPFPGASQRLELVSRLRRQYGADFRVYGAGYPASVKPQGFIPYGEQERENRKARVTASWNHFPNTPYYFSDRLPIALISGVPHVTNAFPGHERVFDGCPGVYFARTPEEAQSLIAQLLKKTDAELTAEGEGARQWIRQHLTCDVVMPRLVRRMQELKAQRDLNKRQ